MPAPDPTPTPDHALWTAPVIVGTPRAVASLAGHMALTQLLPPAIACLLIDEPGAAPGSADLAEIAGIPVLGTPALLSDLHAHGALSLVIMTLPASLRGEQLRLSESLHSLGVPVRAVPPLEDLLAPPAAAPPTPSSPDASLPAPATLPAQGPALNMAELVGRAPYGMNPRLVRPALEAKRVLITGAGGSIGSELCRIVATFRPSLLVMMERSENALFEIDRQLARRFPDVPRKAILHDVVDEASTLRTLVGIKPHVVFHAAAHKHVPLMEDHPALAVTNNLFGTKSIADAAVAVQAERFVLVSTDKAVHPVSTMGATKRLAELYLQWLAGHQPRSSAAPTAISIVRFGNVLGSACSVLPIWASQLAEGGPLTVTDPRMTRYFMTIPEAASLVIQAAALSNCDQPASPRPGHAGSAGPNVHVYELDMGEPIRILDLAQRFARAHGLEPRLTYRVPVPGGPAPHPAQGAGQAVAGPSVEIAITGARPGEKLHEELAYQTDALQPTPCPGIFALPSEGHARRSDGQPLDVPAMIVDMSAVRASPDAWAVRAAIRRHIPTFAEGTPGVAAIPPQIHTNTVQNANEIGSGPGAQPSAA